MKDWKTDLDKFLDETSEVKRQAEEEARQSNLEVEEYVKSTVVPAFEEVKPILEGKGRQVEISQGFDSATIEITLNGALELKYEVRVNARNGRISARPIMRFRLDGVMHKGENGYTNNTPSKDDLIRYLVSDYKSLVEGRNRRN